MSFLDLWVALILVEIVEFFDEENNTVSHFRRGNNP